eukprot:6991202-Prymnesium_polylepis.1
MARLCAAARSRATACPCPSSCPALLFRSEAGLGPRPPPLPPAHQLLLHLHGRSLLYGGARRRDDHGSLPRPPCRVVFAPDQPELEFVLDIHFRPAGPALCCVASTRVYPVRRTHTFTVNGEVGR